MTPTFEAIRSQLPVGQGGLHSTLLRLAGREFWFIYDCGSSNRSSLWRELDSLDNDFGERPLDLLVLSHLDEDHVNGVERLLSRRKVRRVMLPYLDEDEKLVLVARAASNDAVTEANLRLYADPEGWFERHGVEVILVQPTRGGDVAPPDPSPGDPPQPLDDDVHEWSAIEEDWDLEIAGSQPRPSAVGDERGGPTSKASARRSKRKQAAAPRRELPAGEPLTVRARLNSIWELVPFWCPAEGAATFAAKVRRKLKLKGKLTARKLSPVLSSYELRRELADLYKSSFASRNRTSLCLYSGPGWGLRPKDRQRGARAWLSTGDAPLASTQYQRYFTSFFGSRFPIVDTVVLPHHGARTAFPRQGLSGLRPDVWIAAAGKNSYGHPDPGLRAALRRHASFWQVSTRRGTLYSDEFSVYVRK
ncbi:MAG: MBL fold metallo-hydrolase [Myxococcales bacterium]|nr:MBL fold metallo-hydrolase [Myxococcales bacterium]